MLSGVPEFPAPPVLLSASTVPEHSPNGSLIGALSVGDPDPANTYTYSLIADAGARFALNGNRLVVRDGARLDASTRLTHDLRVRATGPSGQSYEQDLVITVTTEPGEFRIFTDASLVTRGLVGSYVNQSLRAYSTQDDWRQSQPVCGTRVDRAIDFQAIRYGAYATHWPNLAAFGISGNGVDHWENFSVQWDGYVQIVGQPLALRTSSGDGSRMWIDLNGDGQFDPSGPEFINNHWGSEQGETAGLATQPLAPGAYRIRLQYEQGQGDSAMRLVEATAEPTVAVFTDPQCQSPGIVGSYVNRTLRGRAAPDDWRTAPDVTISGTRVDPAISFLTENWGNRAEVGITDNWNNFSVQWDGYVQVVQPMALKLRSDDGSRLWIDVNHDGAFDPGTEQLTNRWGGANMEVPSSGLLAPGVYQVRVQYEEGWGGNWINLTAVPGPIVKIAYLIPSNRSAQPDGVATLQNAVTWFQEFYRDQMDRNGFGPKTFTYETEADGVTPRIHVVALPDTDEYYSVNDPYLASRVRVIDGARTQGIDLERSSNVWLAVYEGHLQQPDGLVRGRLVENSARCALVGSDYLVMMRPDRVKDNTPYSGLVVPEIGPYPLHSWWPQSLPGDGTTISSAASVALGYTLRTLNTCLAVNNKDTRNDAGGFHSNTAGFGAGGFRAWLDPQAFAGDDDWLPYGAALPLDVSPFLNAGTFASGVDRPVLSVTTSGTVAPENGLLPITFTASDSDGLASAILFRSDWQFEEIKLSGANSQSATFRTPYSGGSRLSGFMMVFDVYGNWQSASVDATLSSGNRAPVPWIKIGSSTLAVGQSVLLDASNASDPDGTSAAIMVEWDLNGDGTFDTAPATTKTLTTSFAAAGTYLVGARFTDSAGAWSIAEPLPVRVSERVNNSPLDITLTTDGVRERCADGTVVGTLSTFDPDPGETFVYTLVSDADGRFAVAGNRLVVTRGALINRAADPDYVLTVRSTDSGGRSVLRNVIIEFAQGDTTPPVLSVPGDATVEAAGPGGAAFSFTATATDDTDPNPVVAASPASGSIFPLGATTVVVIATDAAGNASTASFTVTVQDTTAPVFGQVPADLVLEATGPDGAVANWPAPSATDLVDGATEVIASHANGSMFPLGTTTVSLATADAAGNTSTASFTVTVQDTTAPVISGIPADINVLATSEAGAVVTWPAPVAEDLVDGTVLVAALPPSGSTFPLGTTTVCLTATDAAGNARTATFTVTVVAPAVLSGEVWVDFNDDGLVDFGEKGIPGVTIELEGVNDLGRPVTHSFQTDSDGAYNFLGLRPGMYRLTEVTNAALAQYVDGQDALGTAGGTLSNDLFRDIALAADQKGLNYNFGERPAPGSAETRGQSATIGFWQNRNGQALIKSFDGGGVSTRLGDWLAATLPNVFGACAAQSNLAGQTNDVVAAAYQSRFLVKGMKLDAQVMATALSVYATSSTLGGGYSARYGFTVSEYGLGICTFNVRTNGAAFGVSNNAVLTVLDILIRADERAVNGRLYNGDSALRTMANSVFDGINTLGDIG